MRRLLNISTNPGDLEIIADDWHRAADLLDQWGFDGFELYPVGDYPLDRIPPRLVTGLHLHFFVILEPIWRDDRRRLINIFGDWQTVESFYGGRSPHCISRYYSRQLNLARDLDCDYVVFHPAHCELRYIWNWDFPWHWRRTLDLCAEVINAATAGSRFNGWVLFENLWWPGSFRLDSPEEYRYLRQKITYPRCGIVLDTGHLLNTNQELQDEAQAISFLMDCLDCLAELVAEIRTVHLNCSLSGSYVRATRGRGPGCDFRGNFWQRLAAARRHVACIDQHDPFNDQAIGTVVAKVAPRNLVFEFSYRDLETWQAKVAVQKKALESYLWPGRCNESQRKN